jgi:hypothetical protein
MIQSLIQLQIQDKPKDDLDIISLNKIRSN